jgi:zinc/manganese transport system substrate-binding protein
MAAVSPARIAAVVALLLAAVVTVATAAPAERTAPKFQVVAAENFWGSIAQQLAGSKVAVTSLIVNPNIDPHDYQPSASDARALAGAKVAIVNGIGYDSWASKLLAANPVSGRVELDVGNVVGLKQGDNPHQWYDPASVTKVVDAIVAAYRKVDPADKAYFADRKRHFETVSLKTYNQLRAQIRHRFAGVPVGYSESIFRPLGADLHLRLATPYSFAKSVSEGTDISAQDKSTVDRQVKSGVIKVWVYNSQNATPDIQAINALCKQHHIPIATVTETLAPASLNFEQWQVAQLRVLIRALHAATGR